MKIKDQNMQPYLEKFNGTLKGKPNIDIELFNDEPLSIKYVRHNQGGKACYCMADSNIAHQKTKNGWQKIECSESCEYRQKDANGKCACNRVGCLKFIIPSICKDRIFYMIIKSQTSLNRLYDYFNLQNVIGNKIKGQYNLFLKQEKQTNKEGKTFNNFLVDIFKKEDFNSTNQTQVKNEEQDDNKVSQENNINSLDNVTTTKQEKTKKVKTTRTSKKEKKPQDESNSKTAEQTTLDEYKDYYILTNSKKEKIADKAGVLKEYLVGEFYDMNDNHFNIVIRPENEAEILECDLGTVVKLDIKDVLGRKFAIGLEFVEKKTKKVVA